MPASSNPAFQRGSGLAKPSRGSFPPAYAFASLGLSGFAALVFEVCWIRRSSLVFGSTTVALSTVLAVFFLGLALGSELFGRVSRTIKRPLRLFAAAEIAIGVLALASPLLFSLADRAYGEVYRAFAGDGNAALVLVRLGLVALVLLPPTILMGASLPLFCRVFVRDRARIAASAGWLYAANTLGGAAGAALTGLALLPAIGMSGCLGIGAAANAIAAGIGLRLDRSAAGEDPREAAAPEPAGTPRAPVASSPVLPLAAVGTLFAITGFAALAGEVLWTRYLSLILRNTVITYTVTLTVVLLGIVLGSALAAVLADRLRARALAFGALQILTGLSTLFLVLLPPAFWNRLSGGVAVQLVLLLPAAVFSGASFPLALRLVTDQAARVAPAVGRLAALNIAGGIAGSLWAGLVALPRFGLHASVLATTGICVAAGVAAGFHSARRGAMRIAWLTVGLAAAGLWGWMPRAMETRVPEDFLAQDGTLVEFREGLTSHVAVVRRRGIRELRIDRWWQGQSGTTHQVVAAHLPMLLHPAPERVLLVGVGTGLTASHFLDYPITRLDCVDIEPMVFDVVKTSFGGAWLDDPRVRAIREDGRNYVAHTAERYDVISLELGQLFRPGVAGFYTLDFYGQVAARLATGGLACQFAPLPFLTTDQFRSVVATFLEVFPYSVLWYNTAELLLIGSCDGDLRLTEPRLRLLESDPRIRADLAYSHWDGELHWMNRPEVMMGGYLCGSQALAALSAGAPLLRDDHPTLEYAARNAIAEQGLEIPTLDLLRRHLGPMDEILDHDPGPDARAASQAVREHNLADMTCAVLLRRIEGDVAAGRTGGVLALAREAEHANPLNHQAHRVAGAALLQLGRIPEAQLEFEAALRLRADDDLALQGIAAVAQLTGRHEDAVSYYRRALELYPEDASSRNRLGASLGHLGRLAEAEREFAEAARLDPTDVAARNNLNRVRAALRR